MGSTAAILITAFESPAGAMIILAKTLGFTVFTVPNGKAFLACGLVEARHEVMMRDRFAAPEKGRRVVSIC